MTVAELRTGIEPAGTPERAAARARVLAAVVGATAVLDCTELTTVEHARLLAQVRRSGTPRGARGAHGLIIAAHAVEHARTVVSLDARARFADLPGVLALAPRPTPAHPRRASPAPALRSPRRRPRRQVYPPGVPSRQDRR
ncbi:MAG TPA: type II toxin-antitoxin system VapC family toxin [Cellulomonas sp.]